MTQKLHNEQGDAPVRMCYQIIRWDATHDGALEAIDSEGLTKHEYESLLEFLPIVRSDGGCSTPVESFLRRLIRYHSKKALTPDDIRLLVDDGQLADDWAGCIENAAFLASQYPELFREHMPAGSEFRTAAEIEREAEEQRKASDREAQKAASAVKFQHDLRKKVVRSEPTSSGAVSKKASRPVPLDAPQKVEAHP